MANPDIPLCDLASLNWVSHSAQFPCREEVLQLYIYSNVSHTHTNARENVSLLYTRCNLSTLSLKVEPFWFSFTGGSLLITVELLTVLSNFPTRLSTVLFQHFISHHLPSLACRCSRCKLNASRRDHERHT